MFRDQHTALLEKEEEEKMMVVMMLAKEAKGTKESKEMEKDIESRSGK